MATCLIIPGLNDSGPEHWQSRWLAVRDDCVRVDLCRWSRPSRSLWLSRLDRCVARTPGPLVLVAHSLGCHAVAAWADEAHQRHVGKVRAALLVAPPDLDGREIVEPLRPFAPAAPGPLPFRSILVASRDDPYAGFSALARLASRWGAELIDAGFQGHLNADSRLRDWTEGQQWLRRLITQSRPTAGSAR